MFVSDRFHSDNFFDFCYVVVVLTSALTGDGDQGG